MIKLKLLIKSMFLVCVLMLSMVGVSSASVSVTSDSKYFDISSGCFVLEGNVLVKTDTRTIGADKARVNLVTKEVWANGNVYVEEPQEEIKFKGGSVYASDELKTAIIKGDAILERPDITIQAEKCSFNWRTKIAEFSGLVEVHQDGKTNVYDVIQYDVINNPFLADKYDSIISTSIFPKTQGGPIQNSLFSKSMCFLKLTSMDIQEYAKSVIDNTNLMINVLKSENVKTINDIAHNHIILIDVTPNSVSGKIAEEMLFKHGVLVNRNQIPNDNKNALITSGIRIGTVPITNLDYSKKDITTLGKYLAAIINGKIPNKENFLYLIDKYHSHINISN
jgi:lipopolysaccharide export system protein LptA